MNEPERPDFYISVDVETAGPNPSQYSLLTIGACTLDEHPGSFYVEIKPVNEKITPEAYAVHRLDMKRLAERGKSPLEAMTSFEAWLKAETPEGMRPVFIAFNAPFDWMFVCDYFHRFLGHNPFGNNALDIKAFYAGLSGATWSETSLNAIRQRYLGEREITHHALRDALDQAEMFMMMLGKGVH